MSYFICQTPISKTASWIKLFFSPSHKNMSWDEAEKKAYTSSLPYFSLSSMHEVIGEVVLPNSFSKTTQLHLESCSRSFLLKNSFTSEAELCQTGPSSAFLRAKAL